jgi:hypothetical protein
VLEEVKCGWRVGTEGDVLRDVREGRSVEKLGSMGRCEGHRHGRTDTPDVQEKLVHGESVVGPAQFSAHSCSIPVWHVSEDTMPSILIRQARGGADTELEPSNRKHTSLGHGRVIISLLERIIVPYVHDVE